MAWFFLLALAGLVLGLGIGALVGYATYEPCAGDCFDFGRGFNEAFGASMGAVIGVIAIPILWMFWWTLKRLTRDRAPKRSAPRDAS